MKEKKQYIVLSGLSYNLKNITIKEEIIAIIKQYQKYFDSLVNDIELAMNIADKIFKHGMLLACICQHEVIVFVPFMLMT